MLFTHFFHKNISFTQFMCLCISKSTLKKSHFLHFLILSHYLWLRCYDVDHFVVVNLRLKIKILYKKTEFY